MGALIGIRRRHRSYTICTWNLCNSARLFGACIASLCPQPDRERERTCCDLDLTFERAHQLTHMSGERVSHLLENSASSVTGEHMFERSHTHSDEHEDTYGARLLIFFYANTCNQLSLTYDRNTHLHAAHSVINIHWRLMTNINTIPGRVLIINRTMNRMNLTL